MKPQYPLVFSTLFVRVGVGVILVHIMLAFVNNSILSDVALVLFSVTCILLGVILSMIHLGKPQRFLHAFSNPSSMLTWEAVIMPLLFGSMLFLAYGAYKNVEWLNIVAKLGTTVFGVLLIYVTAKVYHLKARPSWATPLVVYEFFLSTVCLGILGYIGIASFITKKIDPTLFILIVMGLVALIAEFVVTLYYRHYVRSVSMTASLVLNEKESITQYYIWNVLGLTLPFILSLIILCSKNFFFPLAFGCFTSFFLGALFWRILFFKTATPIKITPDIAEE